jgi:hypothetical protein
MTAITLNLLAEEQLAEQAQARDPFRITLSVGIGVIILTAIAGLLVTRAANDKKLEAATLRAKRDSLASGQSIGGSRDTKSLKSVADELLTMNHGRTLYARQLAMIKDLVPASIQLVRMSFTLTTESADGGGPAEAPVESGAAGAKAFRHKPKSMEHLTLQLDGEALSPRPEIEVDDFIKSLRSDPLFSKQVKDIKLRSIARSAPAADGTGAALPKAAFVIECQYQEGR